MPATNAGPASAFVNRSDDPDQSAGAGDDLDQPGVADETTPAGPPAEPDESTTGQQSEGGPDQEKPDGTDGPDEAAGVRLVLHVPFVAADLTEGAIFGRTLARAVRSAGDEESVEVDMGEATITVEGDQADHRRLFCDRLLGPGRRCVLREGHGVPCHPGRAGVA